MEPSSRHIGFLSPGWTPAAGGVERHASDLARALIDAGEQVSALALDARTAAPSWTTRDTRVAGVPVRRVTCGFDGHERLIDLVEAPRGADAVARWLDERQPDLVHVHHLTGFGTGALRVLAERGIPTVVALHDHWLLCPRGQSFQHSAIGGERCDTPEPKLCASCCAATWPELGIDTLEAARRTAIALGDLALADMLVAPSDATRNAFLRAGVAGDITIIPHGIDAERIARRVAVLREQHVSGKRVGVLGAVQPSKGVLELARAVIAADVPGLTLEVHGPLDAYHGDVATVAALHALAADDGRIRLHGPFEPRQLGSVLATLDAVCVPSRWEEAFGLGAREARAASLPVIASAIGGLLDLRGDRGVTLIDADDPDVWKMALRCQAFTPVAAPAQRTTAEMAADWIGLYGALAKRSRQAA